MRFPFRKTASQPAATSPTVDNGPLPEPITVEWDREPGFRLGAVVDSRDGSVIFTMVRESSVAYHLGIREGMQLLSVGDHQVTHNASRAADLLRMYPDSTMQLTFAAKPMRPLSVRARSESAPFVAAPASAEAPTTMAVKPIEIPENGIRVDVINMLQPGVPSHSERHLVMRNGVLAFTRREEPTADAAPVQEEATAPADVEEANAAAAACVVRVAVATRREEPTADAAPVQEEATATADVEEANAAAAACVVRVAVATAVAAVKQEAEANAAAVRMARAAMATAVAVHKDEAAAAAAAALTAAAIAAATEAALLEAAAEVAVEVTVAAIAAALVDAWMREQEELLSRKEQPGASTEAAAATGFACEQADDHDKKQSLLVRLIKSSTGALCVIVRDRTCCSRRRPRNSYANFQVREYML